MTGAPVPAGADAVVKYEIAEVTGGDGTGNESSSVTFRAPAKPGENIREAGLEAHAGDVIMHTGEVVTAAGAGLLTSAGVAEVAVRRAPRVGILSVGTELVPPTEQPQRGQIRDANGPALMAAALDAGAEPRFFGIVADDEDAIAQAVLEMTESCDFVVTSGGASAGDYDYIDALVQREGEVLFDRISMRPGKAITFGLVRGMPFLGLSGNPAAACVGFEMLARPAIRAMRGHTLLERPLERARVTHDVRKRQERRFYDRARVTRDPQTCEATVTEERSQNSACSARSIAPTACSWSRRASRATRRATRPRACASTYPKGLNSNGGGDEAGQHAHRGGRGQARHRHMLGHARPRLGRSGVRPWRSSSPMPAGSARAMWSYATTEPRSPRRSAPPPTRGPTSSSPAVERASRPAM